MANQLHIDVVSVEKKIWSGEADMLVARTTEGELGLLHGHAPLLGQLAESSQVRIKRPEGDLAYNVSSGFLSVDDSGATILAESAEPATADAAH